MLIPLLGDEMITEIIEQNVLNQIQKMQQQDLMLIAVML